MYSAELAEVYETIYRSRGKNWTTEAEDVAQLIRRRRPEAASLLDVACGTGAHLESFRKLFDDAEGIEIAEPMRKLALERLPGSIVHVGDMRDFDLGRRYDAAVCLFSAIGYLPSVDDLNSAIRCMAAHLAPRGVLVVEPWWFPENHIEGYVAGDMAHEEGRVISRISHSVLQGRATRMEVRFTVADAGGFHEFTEVDVLTLFTRDEYETAFEQAGCDLELLPGPPSGRGLFVGIRR